MNKLTIITQAAVEDNLDTLEKSLASTTFADEHIIYTLFTPDDRLSYLIKKYNQKQIPIDLSKLKNRIVEEYREEQVRNTNTDWVLLIDFDEVITAELAREIRAAINSEDHSSGYAIRRKNYSLGYPLTYGGWGDDFVLRLIYKPDFITWPNNIHSTPVLKGEATKLKSPLLHYKDASLEYIVNKTNRYSSTEAGQYFSAGMRAPNTLTLFRKLSMEIFRRLVLRVGFLDGKIGVIQSIYQGFSVFISYAKLYEKYNQ